ncbi:hypothetical protein ABR737_05405 [Streptomyces sp. Edi2]|uniref:hypothetical protein n=1 Tax=Streptomyces sp. Edi2 TaxID=3162528 RepID=UPI003305AE7B
MDDDGGLKGSPNSASAVAVDTLGTGAGRAHEPFGSVLGISPRRLRCLAVWIAQDRQSLLDVMDVLGAPARRYKVYGGWAAERLGRLKPNGVVFRRSGLSTLIELESLRLGVEGKSLIWRTLLVVAAGEPRLDASRLHLLLDRARDQIDTLETLRRTAAAAVFSPGRAT